MGQHLGPVPLLGSGGEEGEGTEPAQKPVLIDSKLGQRTRAAKQAAFLKAYRNSRNVRASCLAAAIDRDTFYRWNKSAAFHKRVIQADADYLDVIRAELDKRSQASDQVLIFRAKSLLTEYKDTVRQEHVVGDGSGLPIRFTLQIGEVDDDDDDGAPRSRVVVSGTNGHAAARDGQAAS